MRELIERFLIVFFVIGFWSAVFIGCGEIGDFLEDVGSEVEEVDGDKPEPTATPAPVVTPTPKPTNPEPTPTTKPVNNAFFVPNNCDNPPKNISFNDGWKCMASSTRGGSVVCLLPYQFTWSPYKDFTDHHGVTMKCNKNDEHFDAVDLVYKNGTRQSLDWDKCQNWVGTNEGKIGRQHWRAESVKYDAIKSKLATIEMTKGNKKTCLKF